MKHSRETRDMIICVNFTYIIVYASNEDKPAVLE